MTKVHRKLMTAAEYARHRGCSLQAVRRALKEGRITANAEGLVDPVAADAQWAANSRPRVKARTTSEAAQQPAGDTAMTYPEARRREAVARALMAEREQALQAGELVRVALVRDTWGRLLGEAKARLLNMPSRLAPLVHAVSQQQAHEAIRREVHEVLTDLSRSDGAPQP